MVGQGGPPPKRRRTDVPTQSDIERSNATVQHFIGGRQNRWMNGWADANEDARTSEDTVQADRARSNSAAEATYTREGESADNAMVAPSSTRPSVASWGPRSPIRQERGTQRSRHVSDAGLVQYESPHIEVETMQNPSPSTTTTTGAGGKSYDALSRPPGQPGLPSPAPSEENTYSPIITEDGSAISQRPQPSNTYRRVPSNAVRQGSTLATVASPVLMSSPPLPQLPSIQQPFRAYNPSPVQLQNAHAPASPRVPQCSPFSHQQQYQPPQQPPPPQSDYLPSHSSSNHGHRGSTHALLQSVGNSLATRSHAHGYGQALQVPIAVPSTPMHGLHLPRIPRQSLLQWLESKQNEHTGSLTAVEQGRLALLRQAVEKNDPLYLTLSQLFCLRTVSPSLLPMSIRGLKDECYEYLATMLGTNSGLKPDLLSFFAEFPEPMINIYSDPSGIREVYEQLVQGVIAFLTKLLERGHQLLHKSKAMCAIPLVQDLVEMLNLDSPVLQTTYVRFIARQIYTGHYQESGLDAIEKVHLLDQAMYYELGHRRDHAEKMEARKKFYAVYEAWKERATNAARGRQTSFQVPPHVDTFFRLTPSNQNQAASQAAQVAMQQQHIAQQLHLNRMQQASHQRFLATQGQHRRSSGSISSSQSQQPRNVHQQQIGGGPVTPNPHQVTRPTAQHSTSRRVFPTSQDLQNISQPSHPDSARSALHQAHLRSPNLGPVDLQSGATKMYRHVLGFVLPPTRLQKGVPSQKIIFNMSEQVVSRRPLTRPPQDPGGPPQRTITDQSLTFRLRCAIMPPRGLTSESAWTTTDTYWPDNTYFECNGLRLEARRKLHFGRYLPIDLTTQVKTGENCLKVCTNSRSHNPQNSQKYIVAVEVVGVMSHEAIKEKAVKISLQESLNAITKSLSTADAGDDDVAVTSGNVTITLTDPYTGCKMFDIPARGSACLHKDCFDLETFLSLCKRQHPGWPTIVDCWRCPICRGDVRPQTLVIDGFLVSVREELARRGLLDTRAIVVEADGSWKPKEQERTGVRSPSLDREESAGLLSAALAGAKKPEPVVIELD